jgi:type I restriction enzyme S subunit
MITDLKPYAEYKESGLPWLGQVPGHWELAPNRSLMRIRKKLVGDRHSAFTLLSLTKLGVIVRDISEMRGKFSSDPGTSQEVRKGDLVMCLFDVPETPRTVGLSGHAGMITGAYTVMECRRPESAKFLELFYIAMDDRKLLSPLYSGLRNTIPKERLLGTKTPLPPPAEQAAIVRFLDWANGRLERAIRAKRKVIALLNEQKQAIIHRAVTRGLDPSVPLKDSGVPWLGEIPKHWEVSRIKNEFRCLNTHRVPLNAVERGTMTARTYDYYGASGVIDKVDNYLFDDELLLIAEDGANLVLRNLPLAVIARGKFWVNNHAHILKPRRGNIVYLANVLETLDYKTWISGAAQPKLTQDRLMSISIAVAPPDEQLTIVEQTSEQTRPLAITISRLEREITLLREYRTRLVADVVTGKLDVRAAAASLPDEAPLDDLAASRDPDDDALDTDDLTDTEADA